MWQWFEDKRGDYALCARLSNTMMEQMSAYFLVADPKPPFDQGWPSFQDINDTPILSLAKMIGAIEHLFKTLNQPGLLHHIEL